MQSTRNPLRTQYKRTLERVCTEPIPPADYVLIFFVLMEMCADPLFSCCSTVSQREVQLQSASTGNYFFLHFIVRIHHLC
jgi:hypothetical protein